MLNFHIFLIINCEELVRIRVTCEGLIRFFSDLKKWYSIFTNVKNRYQFFTHVKNCTKFSQTILNGRADIILLQMPLAKSICLSGTRFIIWKQGGLRAEGRSLRMTSFKVIAKYSSSQSPAMMFY